MTASFKIDFANNDEKNISANIKALMVCFNAASAGACSIKKPDGMGLLWEGHSLFSDISASPPVLPIVISTSEVDYLRLHLMKFVASPGAGYIGTTHMISRVTTEASDLLNLAIKQGLFKIAP